MFYAHGGSKTLVKRMFFYHDLEMTYTKTLAGTKKSKKTKPLDAPNIDRHEKTSKKAKISSNYPEVGP